MIARARSGTLALAFALVLILVAVAVASVVISPIAYGYDGGGPTAVALRDDSAKTESELDLLRAAPTATDPLSAYDHPSDLALASARLDDYRLAPQTAGAAASVADDVVGAQRVTVLGRYRGGTEAFVGKPGFNVLDLPSRGTGRWYWSRNRAFIDDAIAGGDELRLVTNPFEPLYSGGNVYQRELRYLRDLGYRFEQSGDYWVATPGR